MSFREVFFDVETKKLFGDIKSNNPKDLGISIVSVYTREIDENFKEVKGFLKSFWEKEINKMWSLFQEADRIIGYNSIGFDVPALSSYANFSFEKLPHFDIMLKIKEVFGKRIPLDAVAKETLDREKKETGLDAVYLWQKGNKKSLERLKAYCEDDVLITRDIYDFVLKNGYILFKDKWNTLRKVYLDFTYSKEKQPTRQAGLF